MQYRTYVPIFKKHLQEHKQMLFIEGARQVGKTTIARALGKHIYLSWDHETSRQLILAGQEQVAELVGFNKIQDTLPLVVFDELHKYSQWKTFLKGFYDLYADRVRIVVTGSSKLGIYKKGGDSMMGRYIPYRIHPFSLAEAMSYFPKTQDIQEPQEPEADIFDALLNYGGFPDPFLKRSTPFWNQWVKIRQTQLFKEDIRELTQIQELSQMEMLGIMLKEQTGQLLNRSSLAKKIKVSAPSIARWLDVFGAFFYSFRIQPWHKNVVRSLVKEPKCYLWDWSQVIDSGARFENFIASHLLKFVHYWTDQGYGDYGLYFLRDKQQREVDFLVVKDQKPWFLVEAKVSANHSVSTNLQYFQKQLECKHAFQVIQNMDYVHRNCFNETGPIMVPARTFLSQLI
ncbi:MAG: AAA family ATPase [Pseudomonadota bacterium]